MCLEPAIPREHPIPCWVYSPLLPRRDLQGRVSSHLPPTSEGSGLAFFPTLGVPNTVPINAFLGRPNKELGASWGWQVLDTQRQIGCSFLVAECLQSDDKVLLLLLWNPAAPVP